MITEVDHLFAQMQQTYSETTSKMEAMTQELKLLEDEENDIAKLSELSTQMLAFANEEKDKARQMIVGHKPF